MHGFEIDERAAQLASLALMMKARSYHRRVFRKALKPNILRYQDLKLSEEQIDQTFQQLKIDLSEELKHDLLTMQQATNFGSLIIPHTTLSELATVLKSLHQQLDTTDLFFKNQLEEVRKALNQLVQLGRKYHCIVDNPPYMGGGNMNKPLAAFVKKNYPDSKADLMACFMEAGLKMLYAKGFLGMINLPSWLFLSSFGTLRKKLIKENHIDSLLHMGRGIFGIDWGSTAFVIVKHKINRKAKYFRLHKRNFQHIYPEDIRDIFIMSNNNENIKIDFDKYREGETIKSITEIIDKDGLLITNIANQNDFEKIPGCPVAYWTTKKEIELYKKGMILSGYSHSAKGIDTGENDFFLRYWYEINHLELDISNGKGNWVPYNKGGAFRKWYGNKEYVLRWKGNGQDLLDRTSWIKRKPTLRNKNKWFKEGFTWSTISSGGFSARYSEKGALFDNGGCTIFASENLLKIGMLLNTKIASRYFEFLSPTINFQPGGTGAIALVEEFFEDSISLGIGEDCISISKIEWNSLETSWGFQKNELINHKTKDLKTTYKTYCQYWQKHHHQLHQNEEELNRQFIKIYGLEDELTPDVPLEDITILKQETSIQNGELVFHADEVMRQFISYAVGCMFGRYSLDKEGLVLANQGETLEDYIKKVSTPQPPPAGESNPAISFMPDDDNIIPILDGDWFPDDIVGRFYEFLKVTFGEETYEQNLAFLQECIGKDLRKYFVKDFYKDHIKRYKKRPIYWLFASPKGSFSVLIYLHRYTPDTLNQILNGYLKAYREKLHSRIEYLDHLITTGSSSEQTKSAKEKEKIQRILLELQEYEREILYPLATERIALDLDDGVLVNYNKFGKAIKEVAGLNDKKAKAKVRGFDWIEVEEIRD